MMSKHIPGYKPPENLYQARHRSGQATSTFVVLTVLIALISLSYWFADQYIRSSTSSVWDAVETLNRAIQQVYGIPERTATVTLNIPNHSTLTIKNSGETLTVEATGAFGDRRPRLLSEDSWEIINPASTTLSADGKLKITYGKDGSSVKLSGQPITLGAGRHIIIVRNTGGTTISITVVERGIPTEVVRR
jgi:hypothetical protein